MVLPESDKSFDFSGDGYPFGMGKDFPTWEQEGL
jgi:hypothetical protein